MDFRQWHGSCYHSPESNAWSFQGSPTSANLAHPLTLYFLLFTEGPHVVQAGLTLLSLLALPPKCQDAGEWYHSLVFNRSLGMPEKQSTNERHLQSYLFLLFGDRLTLCIQGWDLLCIPVAQAGLELATFLFQPSKRWDCTRYMPPGPASTFFLS